MAGLEPDTILAELRTMRLEQREDVRRLHDKLDTQTSALQDLKSATAPHSEQIAALGTRVANVETAQTEQGRQLKNVAIVSATIGTGAGALLTAGWGWLRPKLGL